MTRAAAPPPDDAALREAPLHVVVRDWPETLVPLRRVGVDPAARGAEPLGRLPDAEAAEAAVAACLEATAWRAAEAAGRER